MRQFLIILILFSGFLTAESQTWKLVWSDEFNVDGLPDASNWGNEVGFIRNKELQYYTNRRIENSKVENGNLMIIGRKESYDTADYTSASLTTDGKHSWTYGKIEARMKLPKAQGMWPAFWLLGQNIHQVYWPKCGEIDIMEHINAEDKLYGTMHWFNTAYTNYGGNTVCTVAEYHVYSIIWSPDKITWYLDGIKYHEGNIKDNINGTEEFHKPMYIILNLAIGGSWPGSPNSSTQFPDTVFVDYVRVSQEAPLSSKVSNRAEGFSLFPNPVSENMTIDVPKNVDNYTLDIFDLHGRLLMRRKMKNSQEIVSLGELENGIYLVKISSREQLSYMHFIKQ
jgi:beta-glucanase (GH16 family)